MKLIEVSVQTDGEAAEAVSALFNRYGHGGAVTEEVRSGAAPGVVRVKAFLTPEETCNLSRLEEGLWHLAQIYPIPTLSARWLSETDWAEAWKSGYKVQRIGKRFLIKPSWQAYTPAPNEIVIELDPGLAFGTGLHPSTRLMLKGIERLTKPGARVLDVGTGSGILAIAAAKLGAAHVLAVDIDSVAIEVAHANAARNGVENVISLQRASLIFSPPLNAAEDGTPILDVYDAWRGAFDLLLMNILADVITRSAEAIAAALAVGGQFIVSGIIESQEDSVRQALVAAGLTILQRQRAKDWVALIGQNPVSERLSG